MQQIVPLRKLKAFFYEENKDFNLEIQCTLLILHVETISSLQSSLLGLSINIPPVAINLPDLKIRPTDNTSLRLICPGS
jgi:hypothetical protein